MNSGFSLKKQLSTVVESKIHESSGSEAKY